MQGEQICASLFILGHQKLPAFPNLSDPLLKCLSQPIGTDAHFDTRFDHLLEFDQLPPVSRVPSSVVSNLSGEQERQSFWFTARLCEQSCRQLQRSTAKRISPDFVGVENGQLEPNVSARQQMLR